MIVSLFFVSIFLLFTFSSSLGCVVKYLHSAFIHIQEMHGVHIYELKTPQYLEKTIHMPQLWQNIIKYTHCRVRNLNLKH